jgi:hypothetical protein
MGSAGGLLIRLCGILQAYMRLDSKPSSIFGEEMDRSLGQFSVHTIYSLFISMCQDILNPVLIRKWIAICILDTIVLDEIAYLLRCLFAIHSPH